ncbi:hypothetical protein ACWDBD_32290 [Streptomyces sp. NPDC001118]
MRLVLEIPDDVVKAAVSAPLGAESAGAYGGQVATGPADALSAGPAPYIAHEGLITEDGGGVARFGDGEAAQDGGPGPG